MNDVTFIVLKIVVTVCAALISAFVVPLLRQQIQKIKDERLITAIEKAVKAAEQTIKGSGQGAVKKDEVINSVTAWMLQHGIEITDAQLDDLIEAAVYGLDHF